MLLRKGLLVWAIILLFTLHSPAFAQTTGDDPQLKNRIDDKINIVKTCLDNLSNNMATTKSQIGTLQNDLIKHLVNLAEAYYNESKAKLADIETKCKADQLLGLYAELDIIQRNIGDAQGKLEDALKIHEKLLQEQQQALVREMQKERERLENLLARAKEVTARVNDPFINEIMQNALKEFNAAMGLIGQGGLFNLSMAQNHVKRCEFLALKAMDLALKKLSVLEFLKKEMDRLNALVAKAENLIKDNAAASNIVEQARELRAQVRTAVDEKRYLIALRLAQKAEELVHKALALMGTLPTDLSDAIGDLIEQYVSLVSTIDEVLREKTEDRIGKQVANITEKARALADKGKRAYQNHKHNLAYEQYQKAVKLLLRAQDLLNSQPQNFKNNVWRHIEEVKNLLAKAEAARDDAKQPAAPALLKQARTFLDRARDYFDQGQYQVALEQVQAARKLVIKALQIMQDKSPVTVKDQLQRELEEVRLLVSRTGLVAQQSGNQQALRLYRLAQDFFDRAGAAFRNQRYQVCTEQLLTASKFAHRASELACGGSAQVDTDRMQEEIKQQKEIINRVLADLKPLLENRNHPQARNLSDEAQELTAQAGRCEQNQELEAALAAYRAANHLLMRAHTLVRAQDQQVQDLQVRIEAVKSMLAEVRELLARQTNEDALVLIKLADDFLKKAAGSLNQANYILAGEQLKAAQLFAQKALDLARNTGQPVVDREKLKEKLDQLDQDIQKAKDILRK